MEHPSAQQVPPPVAAEDRARRMAASARTCGALAHELANYTGALGTWAHMFREALGQHPRAREELDFFGATLASVNALVDELRAFAHPAAFGPDRTDLNLVVRGAEPRLREFLKDGGRLELRLAPEPLWVNGRTEALEPLVVDPVARAAEALGSGGTVVVETSRLGSGGDPAPAGAPSGARLAVRDDGRVPDADQLARFFEPFAAGRVRGSGLRLAMLFAAVRENGGVTAVTASDGGTQLVVDLPCWQPREGRGSPVG